MPENPPKKKMGRPKVYADSVGAPKLTVRFAPALYKHVQSRAEGPRAYLERVVTEDIQRTTREEGGHQVEEPTPVDDAPGQLLLNGRPQKVKE